MTDNNTFTIGVVGLGLIGGSFAKAYHAAGHKVLAFDTDSSILEFAKLSGNVDADLTRENLKECDLILIAVRPDHAVQWVKDNAEKIRKNAIVVDLCGVKRCVSETIKPIAKAPIAFPKRIQKSHSKTLSPFLSSFLLRKAMPIFPV